MNPYTFQIISGSDQQYVGVFERMRTDGAFAFEKATLGDFSNLIAADFHTNTELREILAQGLRIFSTLLFEFPGQFTVRIVRSGKLDVCFDHVTINQPDHANWAIFAELVTSVQRHMWESSLLNLELVNQAAIQRFEAEEIGLAGLQRELAVIEDEQHSMQHEIQRLHKEKSRLLRDLAEVEDKKHSMQHDLRRLMDERMWLKSELAVFEVKHHSELQAMQHELGMLQEDKIRLRKDLVTTEERQHSELQAMAQEFRRLQDDRTRLQRELAEVEERQHSELQAMQHELETLREDKIRLRQDLVTTEEKHHSELQFMDPQLPRLHEDRSRLRSELARTEEKYHSELDPMKRELLALREECIWLQRERAEMKAQLSEQLEVDRKRRDLKYEADRQEHELSSPAEPDFLKTESQSASPQQKVVSGGILGLGSALAAIPIIWMNALTGHLFERAGKARQVDIPEVIPPLSSPPSSDPNDSGDGDENVEVAVFAPQQVVKGDAVLIQVFCYAIGMSDEARQQAVEYDEDAVRRGATTLSMPVKNGDRIQFHLSLIKVSIKNPIRELIWKSETSSVQYEVQIPKGYPMENLLGAVLISACGVPLGRIGFKLSVVRKPARVAKTVVSIGESATKFRKAFVSYSSDDRTAVLARLQLLRPPLHQIEVFQDLLRLEPGEKWNDELFHQIDECDLFLLFWSSNASKSEWVRREWEYALNRQGPDKAPPPTIFPVIIEGPPPPAPPPELTHLHFNDYLLYFTR